MNLRNKVKVAVVVVIVIQIGCIVASYLSPHAKMEKSAVFPLYAYIMQCTDDYYIVGCYGKYDHAGTAMYYYRDGFTKKPVEITGNSPYHAVDTRLLPDNIFLVKGKFNKEMSDYLGTDILVAESWDIIAPIHRFVEGNCLEKKNRVLAPWWYLDEYDLSVGAYKQVDEKSRKILYWEEEWFRHIWEGHCLAVTAEMDGDEVKWYSVEGEIRRNLMDDKIFTRVQLAGDTPEIYFKNCVTDLEIEQVLDNKKSYFLIHGDYDDSGVFWVDEWHALSLIW